MPAFVAAYAGYKALGGGDPTSAFKRDANATPYQVDDNAASYGGGGGQWVPDPSGATEVVKDPLTGQPILGPDGKPVVVPKKVWASQGSIDAAKYNGISARYRGGAEADYLKGEEDRQRALQARQAQMGMADLMAKRARGEVPSIAEMQAARDSNRLAAEQSSIAASARGPAGLALAQQNAANASATGQSMISQNAQQAAAQERLAAEQAAYGAYSGVRGQDYAGQGLQSQQAQGKGQLGLGYSGLEQDTRKTQGQLGVQREAIKAGQYANAQGLNAQAQAQNTGFAQNLALGVIGGGSSVGAAAAGAKSDAGAKYGITPVGVDYSSPDTAAVLGEGGSGMDVMGTLQKYSAVPTNVAGGPLQQGLASAGAPMGLGGAGGGAVPGLSTGGMLSDERTKRGAYKIAYLDEKPGTENHGEYGDVSRSAPDAVSGASLSGPTPRYGVRSASPSPAPAPAPAPASSAAPKRAHQKTPEEMMTEADAMIGQIHRDRDAALAAGPSAHGAGTMLSDDRTKLAAAWDQGHQAGVSDVQKAAGYTPDRLMQKASQPKLSPEQWRAIVAAQNLNQDASERSKTDAIKARTEGRREVMDSMQRAELAKQQAEAPPTPHTAVAPSPGTLGKLHTALWAARQRAMETQAQQTGAALAAPPAPPSPVEGPYAHGGVTSDERAKRVLGPESPMADANRAQQGYSYAYKPEYKPAEQAPGEKNVGPMAQQMASNPITATAVRRDPDGLLSLDRDKLAKVHSASIADLQHQVDQQRMTIAHLLSRRGSR